MTTKIEASQRNIGEIFSDLYQFEIPPYQRPYAWEEEQARQLLDDLLDAMDNQDASGGLYFLGSIVAVKTPTEARSRVIDGQQRLTTITILLSVLRDLTTDLELRFERGGYIYQKASADKGLKDRYRILLREWDRPFFLKYVQNLGATGNLPDASKLDGSQRHIAENAKVLRTRLEEMPEGRRNALMAFLIQNSYLVVVAVPTAEAARRIFTVLNARGLDLTPTDILKAELLERAGDASEASLANRWEQIEQALGRERLVELFGHIRMIYERDKPRLALEVGFSKFVPPFSGNAESFISDILEPLADRWLLLMDTLQVEKHFGKEAAKAVRSLERIDNKDWLPPTLLRLWKSQQNDTTDVANFLVALERLAYFLFVSRAGVNERIARFAAVMNEFDPWQEKDKPVFGLGLSDIEQSRFFSILSGPLYQINRVCKPVMQRLDEALSSGGASYDELVSIEHVLPQTVDERSEWATLFPDEQERAYWTHRLANLVFLTQRINTRASNWDFEKKKKEYFASSDGSSPFVITQGALQTHKWTPEYLHSRQAKLLEKLAEVWQLDAVNIEEVESPPQKSTWQFTDTEIIEAKRKQIMQALEQREGISLNSKAARCQNDEKGFRAVCTVSKRYSSPRPPYWYGYSPEWRTFLSEGQKSFLAFGCVDRATAYAVPFEELESILGDLSRTPDKHWHVTLSENEAGGLDLVLKSGERVSLKKFELQLAS